jgi:hypothetical protein
MMTMMLGFRTSAWATMARGRRRMPRRVLGFISGRLTGRK